ncbi:hypothetical protein [Rosettibacter firmus]|uniref:hypothetical protein n=1 Tax=Rosettibacter firmus TaxID=3111522 RepID=UPI00336BFDBF
MVKMDQNGHIYWVKGDTFYFNLIAQENSTPIDFTNWHIKFIVYDHNDDIKFILDETNGIDLSTPGLIKFSKDLSTINIERGKYKYDLIVTRANGIIETWLNNKSFMVE